MKEVEGNKSSKAPYIKVGKDKMIIYRISITIDIAEDLFKDFGLRVH